MEYADKVFSTINQVYIPENNLYLCSSKVVFKFLSLKFYEHFCLQSLKECNISHFYRNLIFMNNNENKNIKSS